MTEAAKTKLEQSHIMIDSEIEGCTYAIEKNGSGIHVISEGTALAISAEHVNKFAKELTEVWNLHRHRTVSI